MVEHEVIYSPRSHRNRIVIACVGLDALPTTRHEHASFDTVSKQIGAQFWTKNSASANSCQCFNLSSQLSSTLFHSLQAVHNHISFLLRACSSINSAFVSLRKSTVFVTICVISHFPLPNPARDGDMVANNPLFTSWSLKKLRATGL